MLPEEQGPCSKPCYLGTVVEQSDKAQGSCIASGSELSSNGIEVTKSSPILLEAKVFCLLSFVEQAIWKGQKENQDLDFVGDEGSVKERKTVTSRMSIEKRPMYKGYISTSTWSHSITYRTAALECLLNLLFSFPHHVDHVAPRRATSPSIPQETGIRHMLLAPGSLGPSSSWRCYRQEPHWWEKIDEKICTKLIEEVKEQKEDREWERRSRITCYVGELQAHVKLRDEATGIQAGPYERIFVSDTLMSQDIAGILPGVRKIIVFFLVNPTAIFSTIEIQYPTAAAPNPWPNARSTSRPFIQASVASFGADLLYRELGPWRHDVNQKFNVQHMRTLAISVAMDLRILCTLDIDVSNKEEIVLKDVEGSRHVCNGSPRPSVRQCDIPWGAQFDGVEQEAFSLGEGSAKPPRSTPGLFGDTIRTKKRVVVVLDQFGVDDVGFDRTSWHARPTQQAHPSHQQTRFSLTKISGEQEQMLCPSSCHQRRALGARNPMFMLVDWVNVGEGKKAVDEMNGIV
ncbi:hypothetical protein C8J56DRAFT_892347 [Mycena floridula]|nr:hypothetical protein C8J56DRAFT_892347 [Mycena floridula]